MLDRLYDLFGNPKTSPFVDALVTFAAVMVAGFVLKVFLDQVVRRLVSRTRTTLDDALFEIFIPRFKWVAIIVGLTFAIDRIQESRGAATRSALEILVYVDHLLFLAGIVIGSIIVLQSLNVSVERFLHRFERASGTKVESALAPLLKRIVNIVGSFIALTIILERFGINVGSLLVFLGGSSVALALAAQDTLSNMIAGFVIMIDRPFRVGDRVKLPGGETGDVHEIGLRSSKILDFDGNLIISPNAELVKAKIVNYSYPHRAIRVLVEVDVAYDTDVDKARKVILRLATSQPEVLRDPAPEVFVTSLGDSGVRLMLNARTDDFTKKFKAETDIRERLLAAFAAEGISIPFPQRVIHQAGSHDAQLSRRRKRTPPRR